MYSKLSLSVVCALGIGMGGAASGGDLPEVELVDWSLVTLVGAGTAIDPFLMDECRLGAIEVVYSGAVGLNGIVSNFAEIPLLGIGESGNGPGIMTMNWSNPATSLDVRLYDLDLSETDVFTIDDGLSMELIRDNPLDGGDFLDGMTMRSGGGDIGNGSEENYATIRISGDEFTSLSIAFNRPGGGGGAHAITFGNAVVVPTCPVDLDANCVLNFFDISRFISLYTQGDERADFTGDGLFNFFDVSFFLNLFSAGCP